MKRKFTFLLIALLALADFKSWGQTDVEIGTGTYSNSNAPFHAHYNYSYSQMLYLGSDIGTSGTINSISFYVSNNSSTTVNLNIYMKCVDRDSYSSKSDWEPVTNGDLVCSTGTVSFGQGWVTFTLDTPFQYDGSKNLMIAVDNNTGNYSSSYATFKYTSTSPTYTCIYQYSDGTNVDPMNPSAGNSYTAERPNIKINITESGSCPKPKDLAVSDITTTGATISWSGSADNYKVVYGPAEGFNPNECVPVIVSEKTITLTGLTTDVTYSVAVKSVCSDEEESDWSDAVSFFPTAFQHLTVNDGSSSNDYVPFYGSCADKLTKSQFIIPETSLSALQYNIVKGLMFYTSSPQNQTYSGSWDVYIKIVPTTTTTLTDYIDLNEMDEKVYTGNMVIADNKMVVVFSEPVQYNYGNLLICFNQTSNAANNTKTSWYGVNQNSNTAYAGYTGTILGFHREKQFLPKVTFLYEPGVPPAQYTITFHSNGVESEQTLTEGQPLPDPINIPAGFTFAGWADADIATYTEEEPEYITTARAEEDLYAVLSYGGENNIKYYVTKVTINEEDKHITGNTEVANMIINNGTTITIDNGAILNVSGLCQNDDPEKLVIEDGGQLIVNNSGVQATMKKNIGSTPSKASNVNWYTISSPLAAKNTAFADVTNLIPNNDVAGTDYDLYRFDEANGMWINSRIYNTDGTTIIANKDFTTIDKGIGYIYHNKANTELEFKGEINVNNVTGVSLTLTADKGKGYNLIGNPFTQNIKLTDVTGVTLAEGFYVLTNQNTWGTKLTKSDIKPLQGFLVQVTKTGNATISKPAAKSKGERSNEQNTNIEVIVSNGSYRDNAYAMFGEGTGLNKVNHRNAEAPMLYVPQDGEDFAIAFMDENTTIFPVSFKAMTTGSYSIRLKATDDVSTLVLVDNMTGEETNMLLEDSYTFIGSPADNENRFTVKLKISNSQDEDEHFAYQNGNELVVNGEGTLQIFDVLGRVVVSEEVHGQTVNVGGLNTGAYIVRLTGESVKTQKIVVR